MKRFTSDGLLYVYKSYKVIKLYWHVSFINSYIIMYYIYIYIYIIMLPETPSSIFPIMKTIN